MKHILTRTEAIVAMVNGEKVNPVNQSGYCYYDKGSFIPFKFNNPDLNIQGETIDEYWELDEWVIYTGEPIKTKMYIWVIKVGSAAPFLTEQFFSSEEEVVDYGYDKKNIIQKLECTEIEL